jgi:hypothetical protein
MKFLYLNDLLKVNVYYAIDSILTAGKTTLTYKIVNESGATVTSGSLVDNGSGRYSMSYQFSGQTVQERYEILIYDGSEIIGSEDIICNDLPQIIEVADQYADGKVI